MSDDAKTIILKERTPGERDAYFQGYNAGKRDALAGLDPSGIRELVRKAEDVEHAWDQSDGGASGVEDIAARIDAMRAALAKVQRRQQ